MKTPHGFQTEIEFELPKGYVDEAGSLHRRGTMRLATAADEILPLRDPRRFILRTPWHEFSGRRVCGCRPPPRARGGRLGASGAPHR